MDLKDYKILPGVVIDVEDPKYIGRVKADAPGLFNSEVMNKEGLPWIYPFNMNGYQRFSKLMNGSKIWILTNMDYTEFWYWPMFELNEDSKDIISKDESDYEQSEVLLSRNMGDNSVYIYYSPSQGIMLKNSENTYINIKSNNEIELKAGTGNVLIKGNKVYIGEGDKLDSSNCVPAVKSDKLIDVLNTIKDAFSQSAGPVATPYTLTQVGTNFAKCAAQLSTQINLIKSDNVFLN